MKIFFLTDNKPWFNYLNSWSRHRKEEIHLYCSPGGVDLFSEEIGAGHISPLDLKSNIDDFKATFDIGFSCHCKQIFPKDLVESIQCFNFHPGFNPHNRGWFPQVFSIINGLPVGATLHKMDVEIDHGPIISQKLVSVNSWDTSETIYSQLLEAEFFLFDLWIERLLSGDFEEKKPISQGNYNSKSDFKRLCEIDLNKSVRLGEAIDYLRAMTFEGYDNAFFYDEDGKKVFVSLNLKVRK
jgi:dTDP-4-amino-4,6-dideoxyglucose formyltransferase